MSCDADALVIGAGPAGSATAILLALAGWRVTLVEQHAYPRRKVCGECLAPASLVLLDELGVGAAVRAHAGPELRQLGWMSDAPTVVTDFPPCEEGPCRYGRALAREHLDALLVDRAIALGVRVLQPARVQAVDGKAGAFRCGIAAAPRVGDATLTTAIVVDAHGSWQHGPRFGDARQRRPRDPRRASDLFAFKAVFEGTALRPGLLPVMALAGGYGGMVVAGQGQATIACCLRRDALAALRADHRGLPAGEAVEAFLRSRCLGVREALRGARRTGPWLTVGPLQPGLHHPAADGVFRVGNAAGESHPLIGEGIAMALQSAALLAHELGHRSPGALTAHDARVIRRRYAARWRREFRQRLRVAALYSHVAMRPGLARPVRRLLARWPTLLASAARLAGKTGLPPSSRRPPRRHHEHA
jgi:menaquinone-9 beta-reductase